MKKQEIGGLFGSRLRLEGWMECVVNRVGTHSSIWGRLMKLRHQYQILSTSNSSQAPNTVAILQEDTGLSGLRVLINPDRLLKFLDARTVLRVRDFFQGSSYNP